MGFSAGVSSDVELLGDSGHCGEGGREGSSGSTTCPCTQGLLFRVTANVGHSYMLCEADTMEHACS